LQKQGLNNAQENPISFIQGPPGTGKTFTGATIALYFSILEKGGVLLTAPSNFAADGAAEKIAAIAVNNSVLTSIFRIYSHSRQNYLDLNEENEEFPSTFSILHKEVKKSDRWLQGLGPIQESK